MPWSVNAFRPGLQHHGAINAIAPLVSVSDPLRAGSLADVLLDILRADCRNAHWSVTECSAPKHLDGGRVLVFANCDRPSFLRILDPMSRAIHPRDIGHDEPVDLPSGGHTQIHYRQRILSSAERHNQRIGFTWEAHPHRLSSAAG